MPKYHITILHEQIFRECEAELTKVADYLERKLGEKVPVQDADYLRKRLDFLEGRLETLVREDSSEVRATTPPPPPRKAERLLCYALPRDRQESIIGDLEEYYIGWLRTFGPREARRLYWWHAIRSIAPILWTAARRSAILTFILGAADWLRDRFG